MSATRNVFVVPTGPRNVTERTVRFAEGVAPSTMIVFVFALFKRQSELEVGRTSEDQFVAKRQNPLLRLVQVAVAPDAARLQNKPSPMTTVTNKVRRNKWTNRVLIQEIKFRMPDYHSHRQSHSPTVRLFVSNCFANVDLLAKTAFVRHVSCYVDRCALVVLPRAALMKAFVYETQQVQ
jgi:hypothetical protein